MSGILVYEVMGSPETVAEIVVRYGTASRTVGWVRPHGDGHALSYTQGGPIAATGTPTGLLDRCLTDWVTRPTSPPLVST